MLFFVNQFDNKDGGVGKVYWNDRLRKYVVKFFNSDDTPNNKSNYMTTNRTDAIRKASGFSLEDI